MDTSRISFGEMVAGASGLALFIIMFLPWYGIDATVGGVTIASSPSYSAWEVFGLIDIILFLTAALAIGMAIARAAGAVPAGLPAPPGMIVAGAGALAFLLILYRLLDVPVPDFSAAGGDVDATRKIGAFLGLIAAGGVAFGGFTATNERASGQAPPPAAGPPPAGTPPAA